LPKAFLLNNRAGRHEN